MGTDITAFVEVKIGDAWHVYSSPRIRRNYALFSRMAGVRGDETPIIQPRELPDNASIVVQIAHSRAKASYFSCVTSWFDKSQIRTLVEWAEQHIDTEDGTTLPSRWVGLWEHEQLGYITGNAIYGVPGEGYPAEFTDVRLIFWFD